MSTSVWGEWGEEQWNNIANDCPALHPIHWVHVPGFFGDCSSWSKYSKLEKKRGHVKQWQLPWWIQYVVGFGELCFLLLWGCAQKIEVSYVPFTGRIVLEFLVIALLDQNIQNWIKLVVIRGNDECHGGRNMSLMLCFFVVVKLGPENRSALHPMGCIHFWRLVVATKISCATTRICCKKTALSDKDNEICHHQPSSPAAASSCPVTKMSPLFFVVVEMAMVVVVLVNAIDLEKSFKPSQQLKSQIEYAKTWESEFFKKQKNAMSQFGWM
jgi:hypothetical protein